MLADWQLCLWLILVRRFCVTVVQFKPLVAFVHSACKNGFPSFTTQRYIQSSGDLLVVAATLTSRTIDPSVPTHKHLLTGRSSHSMKDHHFTCLNTVILVPYSTLWRCVDVCCAFNIIVDYCSLWVCGQLWFIITFVCVLCEDPWIISGLYYKYDHQK